MQTDEASAINTEAEMQQASDAMQEALKGNSAASAALNEMDIDAATQEMVRGSQITLLEIGCIVFLMCCNSCKLQVPPPVSIELRQALEDMGFSANK